MSNCTACGTELEPLDVECSACGSVRDDDRVAERAAKKEVAACESHAAVIAAHRQAKGSVGAMIVIIVGVFALLDFLYVPVMWGLGRSGRDTTYMVMFVAALWIATLGAQFSLMTIWLVHAPVRFLRRVGCGLVAVVIWYGAVFAGALCTNVFRHGPGLLEFLLVTMTPLPLFMMAIQMPLWCIRIWFGWRVELVVEGAATTGPRRPLRILDLMLTTGAVAVALALAKLGNPGRGFFADSDYLGILLFYSAVASFLSALSLPLCLWVGLRKNLSQGAIGIAIGIHAAIIFVPLFIIEIISGGMAPSVEVWGYGFLAMVAYFMIVILILAACRRYDYYLRTNNE